MLNTTTPVDAGDRDHNCRDHGGTPRDRIPRGPRGGPGWPAVAAVSAGGVAGALSRYGLQHAFPDPAGGFGWTTFGINVTGCLLIGVLMVLMAEVWPRRPLVRLFLGAGVLGGFTTFSAYALDIQRAVAHGRSGVALAYLAATVVASMGAVWLGATVAGRVVR